LVGTDDIDVTEVDLDSLLLTRADGEGGAVAPLPGFAVIDDVATPFPPEDLCDCHQLGPDGVTDLKLKFHRTTLTDVLQLGGLPGNTLVELKLSGLLTSGLSFDASDCIRIVPASGEGGWWRSDD
jgi:hypothetical protein